MTEALVRALDARAASGNPARLWLRDDDAVRPTPALDRLLELAGAAAVPVTLAVIPAHSGAELSDRLQSAIRVNVSVHGWSHANHAPASEKKQEIGAHRPAAAILAELARGLSHLAALHAGRFVPVLVPPWNRIDPGLVPLLPALGYQAISVFGPPKPGALAMINTHVDVMDWHDTRGGRPDSVLLDELTQLIGRGGSEPIGLLTHHLVHDAQAWGFIERLFALTAGHPGCRWISLPDLIRSP